MVLVSAEPVSPIIPVRSLTVIPGALPTRLSSDAPSPMNVLPENAEIVAGIPVERHVDGGGVQREAQRARGCDGIAGHRDLDRIPLGIWPGLLPRHPPLGAKYVDIFGQAIRVIDRGRGDRGPAGATVAGQAGDRARTEGHVRGGQRVAGDFDHGLTRRASGRAGAGGAVVVVPGDDIAVHIVSSDFDRRPRRHPGHRCRPRRRSRRGRSRARQGWRSVRSVRLAVAMPPAPPAPPLPPAAGSQPLPPTGP